jgi:hypothetical protein
MKVLMFISILFAAFLAGGQLLVLMVIVPTKREWPTELSVRIHQAMLHTLPDRYLLPSGVISSLAGIAILVLNWVLGWHLSTAAVVFYFVGLLGSVGVVITSQRFNKPTNVRILGWQVQDIPADYPSIRDRWDRIHAIRTACGTTELICFIIASLVR